MAVSAAKPQVKPSRRAGGRSDRPGADGRRRRQTQTPQESGEIAAGTREPCRRRIAGGQARRRAITAIVGMEPRVVIRGCVACQDLAAAVAGGVDQDVLGRR